MTRDAWFGEGVGAHDFRRVELLGGRAPGRPRDWQYVNDSEQTQIVDFVFDGGRHVTVRHGPPDSAYYFIENTGQVEVVGLSLDLGFVYCAMNTERPVVRDIFAESPGQLEGQCGGDLQAFSGGSF